MLAEPAPKAFVYVVGGEGLLPELNDHSCMLVTVEPDELQTPKPTANGKAARWGLLVIIRNNVLDRIDLSIKKGGNHNGSPLLL